MFSQGLPGASLWGVLLKSACAPAQALMICTHVRACRPLVADTFAAFGVAWQDHRQFAKPLVGSLLADMQRIAGGSGPTEPSEVHRLLALANSWTAILRSAGPYLALDWSGDSPCGRFSCLCTGGACAVCCVPAI